jgi:ATP-dependent phosphofructokinase / diphosphate-dependent phosphofructokinase
MGLPIVGVPKTIDNDLVGTDYTFGFQTAVAIACEALDRLHTTAEAHHRVLILEVMGRHTGWIALEAGIAGGADDILIPEKPFDIDEVCDCIKKRQERGRNFSIIVAAEGAKPKGGEEILYSSGLDEFGHVRFGGVGYYIEKEIEKSCQNIETRVVVLGHLQRGVLRPRLTGYWLPDLESPRLTSCTRANSARWLLFKEMSWFPCP